MRIIYLILAVLAVSCAANKPKPAVVLEQHADQLPNHAPQECGIVTAAINKGDWAALRTLVKPGMKANDYITVWENAMKHGHAVQVGKLLNVQTVAETNLEPIRLYSFSLENKDGTVNPHWLQIKVREEPGKAEILDFWNFGW